MRTIFVLCLLSLKCFACCDFLIQAQDGAYVVGRSLEFGKDLDASVMVHARGKNWQSTAPGNAQGISWQSKYGYLAVAGMGMDAAFDGMNEKGLSAAFLWMPSSEYPAVPSGKNGKALAIQDLCNWVLGNFSTVEEVKKALAGVFVWGQAVAQLGGTVPPLHLAVHDAQGNSAVVEFMNGKMQIYDNPLGVLTNFPTFDWHMVNIRQYINLKALNAAPLTYKGTVIGQTGQGSGMVGLPGDWTPPSRFVRVFAFKEFSSPAKTAFDEALLALHLLNTVDIPYGAIQEGGAGSDNIDYTQWVVVKDITNKKFYYRTYGNQNVYTIDFSKFDLSAGKKYKAVPLSRPMAPIDVTADLQ